MCIPSLPSLVNLSQSMLEELESNPIYQSMDQHHGPPCTTNVPQGDDVYSVRGIISSTTVETQTGTYEAVYSEPMEPSLSTDALQNLMDSEYLQPYTHQSCK